MNKVKFQIADWIAAMVVAIILLAALFWTTFRHP